MSVHDDDNHPSDKPPSDLEEIELDELEWDDALAEWEDELDETAEAKAEPMPQRSGEAAPSGASRPLYRPPSPDETFARRPAAPRAPTPPPLTQDFPGFEDEEEDEVMESTRIAAIPQELINSLVGEDKKPKGGERATRRPPPPAPRSAAAEPRSSPSVDLDLDGLLDGLDEDTRAYSPTPPYRPATGEASAPRSGSAGTGSAGTGSAGTGSAGTGSDDDDSDDGDWDDVVTSFRPPAPDPIEDEPLPQTRIAASPLSDDEDEPLPQTRVAASPLSDDEDEPLPQTRIVASPLLEAETPPAAAPAADLPRDDDDDLGGPRGVDAGDLPLPVTRIAASPLTAEAEPEADAASAPSAEEPAVEEPAVEEPAVEEPAVPKPAGVAQGMPKPPRPRIPKPSVPRPTIPKPGGAPKPSGLAIPKPPRPGGLGIPKPPRPGGLGIPKPPKPGGFGVPKPPRPGGLGIPKPPRPGGLGFPKPAAPAPDEAPTAEAREPQAAEPSAPPQALDEAPDGSRDAEARGPESAGPPAAPPTVDEAPAAEGAAMLDAGLETPASAPPNAEPALETPPVEAPAEPDVLDLTADAERAPVAPSPDAPIAPPSDERDAAAATSLAEEARATPVPEAPAQDVPAQAFDDDLDALLESAGSASPAAPAEETEEPEALDAELEIAEDQDLDLATGDEDDEDFDLEIGPADDDDDELVFETAEIDEEEAAAIAAAEAAEDAARSAAPAAPDRGALAARRSVRSRKPRNEVFPMVGDGAEALSLRKRLLVGLAAKAEQGPVRARLLVSAAEMAEQLGETEDARAFYRDAVKADPTDVVALHSLRRDAVLRGAWDEVRDLFETEAALDLDPWERALALTGLAEIQLSRLGDAKAAAAAAERALEAQPESIAAVLLLAEAKWRLGASDEALAPFSLARDLWDDPDARAALAVEEARRAEAKGEATRAKDLFAWANEVDPEALDAWFGRARTSSRVDADPRGAVEALATLAAYCGGALGEAILTRASRVATRMAKDPSLGVRLLAQATGVVPLQARADAAGATGDRGLELGALEGWASAAGGTDRALALVRMAEAKAATDDLDGAEAALRDAALADGSLGTIRVVREVIARRSGDMSRLVDAVGTGGALSSAARVARDPASLERERDLLSQAAAEGAALVAADVLALDVWAALGDAGSVDTALRRQADRVPPEQRVGSLIALSERAIDREDLDAAEALLSEGRQILPGDPLLLRPLGRLSLRRDPTEAAALWLEESSVSEADRSAHAATQAGRILAGAGADAVGAYRRALDAVPGYGPAAWALKPLAMELGDPLTLGDAHEQLARTAAAPEDAAGHLARGALLRADADPAGAGALLSRARELAPDDAVLQSLSMRLTEATAPTDRAAMLEAAASTSGALLARVFRLQAASALEDAGEPARAAALYREVLAEHDEDPVVRLALDRAELEAGETARVAERRFAAVKSARDDAERVHALEQLAALDLYERDDPASAMLSLQSILETAPGHLPSLRALQRYFADQNRIEDVARAARGLAEHVEEGPDVTAHVRLARRLLLADPDAPGDAADDLLITTAPRAELDLWLAPRVLAAALEGGATEIARDAARALAGLLSGPEERASARVRAAELLEEDEPDAALALLREALSSSPNHPVAADVLARVSERGARDGEAAEALEASARASEVRSRAAALFYRAGELWEQLGQPERSLTAFEAASERDVTHGDLFERLEGLLKDVDDKARLADLYAQRLAAGGDDQELVELYVAQASLRQDIGDAAGAKTALRSALALSPERLDALRSLANMCLDDEDWRGAAEVLIRIARIRKEREELRWVFFTLGNIYDQHMPDPRRAEAAFKRVLKLLPQDVQAMERLAGLYERENQLPQAAQMFEALAEVDGDPEGNRAHRLKLAEIHERLGDARKAEQVLEAARKNAPTDLAVLRGLAEFYRRQDASNAMAMHLSRAVNDFRHALDADLGDAAAWPGLVEILTWQGRPDAASTAASAAQALGVVDIEISKLVDARGAAPGAGRGAASEALDDLLAPPQLSAPARAVFQLAGEALEKSLPFDVAAYRAEKIGPRDTSIRPLAVEVGHWFGVTDPQIYVTSAAPRVCVPVYSNPVTLLVGSELLGITDDREKLFVLVRAFKIAKAQMSLVVRAQPQEVLALVGGLVQSYDPHHAPAGVDSAHLAEAARRVAKNVSRKVRDDLGPLVFEMAGRPGYDPSRLAMAASEWGNRVALVASGAAPAAVSALAKLSGEREMPTDPPSRLAMIQRFPEAASLLSFAISDAHFEARRRAGLG